MSPPPEVEALLAHTGWVRQLALQLCRDAGAAEDAAQTTWLAALQRPPQSFDRARAFLARTLRRVLQMQARGGRRRQRREAATALREAAAADAADELVARAELHRELVAQVLALPAPQRELVLRHYFEGDDVAALAQAHGISADAVRAHLRRARATLRRRLQRCGGDAWYGLLSLAPGLAANGGTAAALAAGACWMQAKLVLGAAAAAAGLFVCVWAVSSSASPPPTLPAAGPPVAAATAAGPGMEPAVRIGVPPPEPRQLRGRLVGLHSDLPWSTLLQLRQGGGVAAARPGGAEDGAIVVAADGSFAIDVAVVGDGMTLHLSAADPWYEPFEGAVPAEAIAGGTIDVAVRPVDVVLGRVVDASHAPLAGARVLAFAAEGGVPSASRTGEVVADADGCFRLRLDAAREHLVVALPPAASADAPQPLLPVAASVAVAAVPVRQLLPIALPEAAFVSGCVRWADGRPAAAALVRFTPPAGVPLDRELGLGWLPGGALVQRLGVPSGADGRFAVPAAAGIEGSVVVERVGLLLPARFPAARAAAPCELDLRIDGRPVCLHVLEDGKPAAGAGIEWRRQGMAMNYRTGADGELQQLVLDEPFAARASSRDGSRQSGWMEFPGAPPDVVELQLLPPAGESVQVVVRSEPMLASALLSWQPMGGGNRIDASVPLTDGRGELRVAVGRYRLRLLPSAVGLDQLERVQGRAHGAWLLPCEREVEVPAAAPVELQGRFGGRLRLSVTDAAGSFVAGSCRLIDGAGAVTEPHFTVAGSAAGSPSPGRFQSVGACITAEVLAPGSYRIELELGAHGQRRERVQIEPRQCAELRLRLP